jgi:hypothetical protein
MGPAMRVVVKAVTLGAAKLGGKGSLPLPSTTQQHISSATEPSPAPPSPQPSDTGDSERGSNTGDYLTVEHGLPAELNLDVRASLASTAADVVDQATWLLTPAPGDVFGGA